jgi:hypothetical protein
VATTAPDLPPGPDMHARECAYVADLVHSSG